MSYKNNFKLKEGEKFNRPVNEPILGITGTGKNTFIWVGNNAENDKMCFATLSGAKRLEKLALAILDAVRQKPF